MSKLKQMLEERARVITEAQSLNDTITDKTSEADAQHITEQVDRALSRAAELDSAIDREQRLAAAVDSLNQADHRRPGGKAEGRGVDDGEMPTYREAFHEWVRSKVPDAPPMSAAAQHVLRTGYVDGKELRAQTVGTNTAGGFTVPTELQNILIRSMLAFGPMYNPGITQELVTASGNPIEMPTVNDTGVTAGAHTEGATLTDDGGKDVTFGQKVLNAYAFDTEWIRVSKELAEDSIFAMETLLGSLLGERLGRLANLQLTTGSGSDAPNGIVTASTLGHTAAATNAITFDEIIDLEHSVDPAYRTGPMVRYMLNDATLKAVRKLKDGDGNYLWQEGNVQAGIPSTINGHPYSINQAMAGLGAGARVMLFGDFSKYYVRKVGAPLVGAIQDKDFWPGFGMAGYIRFDGELADTAAVKHLITAAT